MKLKAMLLAAICTLAISASLVGEVEFFGLDQNKNSQLLFSAKTDVPGAESYTTLFSSDLKGKTIKQLTFYPEEIQLLNDSRMLQIQNRFGLFRTDDSLQKLAPIPGFPNFLRGSIIKTGKIEPVATSPDGHYLAYIVPTSSGYGRLMLSDVQEGKDILIAQNVERSFSRVPMSWSADSRFFIYGRSGVLYYFSIDQYLGNRIPDESYRVIGPGTVNQVRWVKQNDLYYVSGVHVYRILASELFTRSLYSSLINIGTVIGKLPFSFDCNFDDFYISPDGRKILFDKDDRNVFIYYLTPDDYRDSGTGLTAPALFLPRDTALDKVFWNSEDVVTVITRTFLDGKASYGAFRIRLSPNSVQQQQFAQLDLPRLKEMVLSPDGTRFALMDDTKMMIYDYAAWKLQYSVEFNKPLHILWKSDTEIVVAGASAVELYSLAKKTSSLITLTQADNYGWSLADNSILVRSGGVAYRLNSMGEWSTTKDFSIKAPDSASDSYRVYLDNLTSGSYKNLVMIREAKGYGTNSLFIPPDKDYAPFPITDDPRDPDIFAYGSRIRQREVALVFDAIDEVEGLNTVLNTLSNYGIRATFFVNGEFMRRNPGAVKEIANSGHEVGSLFFANFNMTDNRYKIDADFIRKGLARNEDDYFAATGKELSLIWHTPYYVASSDILAAAKTMNYAFVGRDIDPLDWVTDKYAYKYPGTYYAAHDIIERIMKAKKPGSIIPIRIGISEGNRSDYLFTYLDVLINALIAEGFNIVPVSTLMDHVK